jgi:hypothetical protein
MTSYLFYFAFYNENALYQNVLNTHEGNRFVLHCAVTQQMGQDRVTGMTRCNRTRNDSTFRCVNHAGTFHHAFVVEFRQGIRLYLFLTDAQIL